jgi:excisionase family DNA binding protein
VGVVANLTGFSVHTIRDWCEQGLLPARKIGNRWRLDRKGAIMAIKDLDRRRRRKRNGQDIP